jgi:hypothetical protein
VKTSRIYKDEAWKKKISFLAVMLSITSALVFTIHILLPNTAGNIIKFSLNVQL